MLLVPSKLTPFIVLAVSRAVAVEALPVKAPVNAVDVTADKPVIVVSKLSVTVPLVPPPVKFVPAVTPVISPTAKVCQSSVPLASEVIKTWLLAPTASGIVRV